MSATAVDRPPEAAPRLLVAAGLGAAVAVALGVYGRVHDPSQELVFTLFFSSTISMKVWLASVALLFGVTQVLTALWVYGKLPVEAPPWAGTAHRISGRMAFIVSLPVAYHCLWSLGFQDSTTRVLAHSLLGCAFYGAMATKLLALRATRLPKWSIPVIGATLVTTLTGIFLTSSLWFFTTVDFPALPHG